MRARYILGWLALLLLALVGCRAPQAPHGPPTGPRKDHASGTLSVDYPAFRTIEELRSTTTTPFGEEARLFVFEKDDIKVAVCVQLWGGVGSNALIIYKFQKNQDKTEAWVPYIVWDTQSRDVKVAFDPSSGAIVARSAGGSIIFQTNISALRARGVPWDW
jgi:hypothetical protein